MTKDEERHADEVNIAFQMGAEWERAHTKARIETLEAALREIMEMSDQKSYGFAFSDHAVYFRMARKALDAK